MPSHAALPAAIALLFWIAAAAAHADTGILDNIAGGYKTASASWATTLLAYANRLFMLLATIELAWSFAVWVLEKNELQSFVAAVTKKIMWIGIFYALLLYGPVWVPAIIDSFSQAGATAGGATGLSPSEVFTTGLDNAATMLAGIQKLSLLDDAAVIMLCGLSAIVIVLAFAVIAGQLLVALVESYIAISAGLLFLGFGGSRWTTDFVQKYIGYAVATGVKLFMLYLIIGIGNTQAATWKAMLATIGTPGVAVFNIVLTVMGGAVMLAYLAFQIPAMAAAMLAGSPTLTAGAAAATAATLGAGIVGMGAGGTAAALSGAKSVGGLGSAAGAAFKQAGEQGSSGAGRAISTLGNMGSAALQDSGNRLAQAIAPTKGGRMADISRASAAERGAANQAVLQPAPPPPPRPPTPPKAPTTPPGPEPGATPAADKDAGTPAAPGTDQGTSGSADGATTPSKPDGTPGSAEASPGSVSPPQESQGETTSQAAPSSTQAPKDKTAAAVVSAVPSLPQGATSSSAPATTDSSLSSIASQDPDSSTPTAGNAPDRNAPTSLSGAPEFQVMAPKNATGTAISSATPPDGDFAALITSLSPPLSPPGAAADPGASGPAGEAPAAPPAKPETSAAKPDSPETPSAGAPPGQPAPQATAPTTTVTLERSAPAAPSAGAASSSAAVQKAPAPQQERGLEAGLRSLQQIRAPQIPSDAAPQATVNIRFDAPHE